MPKPTRLASAGATIALAAAPIPLPFWSHGAKPDRRLGRKTHVAAPGKQWRSAQPAVTWHDVRVHLKSEAKPQLNVHSNAHTKRIVHHHSGPRAHAAGDPGNTISDFRFSPGTTTIHVGDAITWTNAGPAPHTATARDGSFDTGTLAKGASASHTFTHSGTFAYICKIHPFMKGTVVVLGTTASPAASHPTPAVPSAAPSSTPAAPAATVTPAAGKSQAPVLPVTGIDVLEVVSVGLVLLALGWRLRGSARAIGRAPRKPRAGATEL